MDGPRPRRLPGWVPKGHLKTVEAFLVWTSLWSCWHFCVVNPSLPCPSPWSAIKSTVFLNSGGRVNLWRKGQILPSDSAFSSENPYKLFNCHPPWSQSPSCGSQWDKKVCRHPYFQSWVKNSLFSVWQNLFWHIHCYHLTGSVAWVM